MVYNASRKDFPADVAQLAEQLFRKQQVVGSSPTIGSSDSQGVSALLAPLFLFLTPILTPTR
jgi:hypothetical protein